MSKATPESILKRLQSEEKTKQKGKLKIFFGYAAGVGKTYAMLEAAQEAKQNGIDVVLGYIEPHARKDTEALTKGLESVSNKIITHGNVVLREFDLDGAIQRHPKLILVDEFAHTNAPNSRNEKRYQDIEELLNAGIDVYTTLNVQHIESLHDVVSAITGISVQEHIPDSVFDKADQVEIVDIEPSDLLLRLKCGKVYKERQAQLATKNFFTLENLTALREIALRRCADLVNAASEAGGIKQHDDYHTEEHILVCLSSSPSNAKIIRTAARMANAFHGAFTAVFVETTEFQNMSEENVNRLRQNMHLAEQLGAKIETVYGDDVAFQISEFSRLSGVSKIVIGRSSVVGKAFFRQKTLVEKLVVYAPQIDIYIIPDASKRVPYVYKQVKRKSRDIFFDLFWSVLVLCVSTAVGMVFYHVGFAESNIILVYVLGVLITALVSKSRFYSVASSLISVLLFNFFFTEPLFSLKAYDASYPVTFVIMFLSASLTSSLAVKLKTHAKKSALIAARTKILLDTSQSLQQAKTKAEIMAITAKQLIRLLKKDIVCYTVEQNQFTDALVFYANPSNPSKNYLTDAEKTIALWVLKNNKHAGATTKTLSNTECLYLSVRLNQNIYGVIGIAVGKEPLDAFQKSILLSILGECALALENEKNAREKEEAAVLAKNEQLRANLLRAISHDLRTPLTSISGNASNFLYNGDSLDETTKKKLFTDIYDDSMWLINLVENLLSVTRLEENRLHLHLTLELVPDVIDEALKHVNRQKIEHQIQVENEDDILIACMDAKLIMQVIINIVDNAIKYTAKGSTIRIKSRKNGDFAEISVEDNGEGIPDEMKDRIFDMFYTGTSKIVDSRRSLGLGLSLCKSIILAHGGEIFCVDTMPHGTTFRFTIPIKEVQFHE